MDNNIKFAQFLEWEKVDMSKLSTRRIKEGVYYRTPFFKKQWTITIFSEGFNYVRESLPEDFEFHTNWNWLMLVVDKIESLGYTVEIVSHYASVEDNVNYTRSLAVVGYEDSKINMVYDVCIKFIDWYNKKTEKEKTAPNQ